MGKRYGVNNDKLEKLMWSIALPGFGQLLNQKYIKGIIFIGLEFLVNVMGNFNQIILLSFHGKISEAIAQTDYGWLMFYPCLYFFAMWDAYKDGEGESKPYAFLPFVFSAYMVTVGCIYSPTLTIFGVKPGPVFLPMLFLPFGLLIGGIIRWILLRRLEEHQTADN